MKIKDLIILGVGVLAIVFVAIIQPQMEQADEEADLLGRIEDLEARANAGSGEFFRPDSPNLDPALEYMNASATLGENVYDITIFDAEGIIEERKSVQSKDLDNLAEEQGWSQTMYHYSSDIGQKELLFMRRKP
jgi:hypothetical protein